MKVGSTGTRMGMSCAQQKAFTILLHRFRAGELHHGDCRGSDEQAHEEAKKLGLHVVGHPPIAAGLRAFCDCDEWRPEQEYLARNRALVLETELLIATPDGPERRRSGTWATIRYAKRIRVPVVVVALDGSIDEFCVPALA